jgi:hypothetical protein
MIGQGFFELLELLPRIPSVKLEVLSVGADVVLMLEWIVLI